MLGVAFVPEATLVLPLHNIEWMMVTTTTKTPATENKWSTLISDFKSGRKK